jgi:hypothetical protein
MILVDLSALSKYNNNYRYLLNVIDAFSRYAWSAPLKHKAGKSVVIALAKLFQVRKPITIQSDKSIEFVNATVQQYLKREGIEFHTTHNPDIKGAVIERSNRTLKTRMYKFFTKFNTYRYLDALSDRVTSYNRVLHSTMGMAPDRVSPTNVYTVWQRVNRLQARIPVGQVKFNVGDHVGISKQKVLFAKGYEQTYSADIFRVTQVIQRKPQPVYQLTDLQDRPIEGMFYNYELVKVTITADRFSNR